MTEAHMNRRVDDERLRQILLSLEEAKSTAQRVAEELKLSQAELRSWQTIHKTWCLTEFTRLDKIISPIKDAFEVVDKPARWVGRMMVVTMTGALIWMGSRLAEWLAKHFN